MTDKPMLLILPGWGGSNETWKRFLSLASKDYDASCLDLPCFGDTPCPSTRWGISEYAQFVVEEMKRRAIIKPLLLGHSFGGQIAVRLAAEHPELFSKLILVGAAVVRPKFSIRRFLFWCIAKIGHLLFRLPMVEEGSVFAKQLLYRLAASPDYLETAGIKRDIFKKVIREDQRRLLPSITLPTLVVWGTHDRYTPLRYGKRIFRLIPHARLEIIPKGKHGLHIQAPERLLEKIRAFVFL